MALIISSNFSIKNVVFSGRNQTAYYDPQRTILYYRDEQNRPADLCIEKPIMMSYGIQKHGFQNSSIGSYNLHLRMDNIWMNKAFLQILEKCKEHLNISTIKTFVKKVLLI